MSAIVSGALTCAQSVYRKKAKGIGNPLRNGIWSYVIISARNNGDAPAVSEQALPKRYTLYSPLLLLPVNFLSHTQAWHDAYCQLDASQRAELFCSIAQAFSRSGQHVTHIAVNAPIPAFEAGEETRSREENVLRSPSRLVPLYGDFGPSSLQEPAATAPSQDDFDAAFWVTTKQSQNVNQVWSPRWTMFSRGNVAEKTRILGENNNSKFPGLNECELGQAPGEVDVLDMYVGIGYFAFSYLARGFMRVYGWDLNPWSLEGLRRGCEANGWRCLLVSVADGGNLDGTSVKDLAKSIVESDQGHADKRIRCVAFSGDNQWSPQIMAALDQAMQRQQMIHRNLCVRHINLGLLPSSRKSWKGGVVVINAYWGGWLHVHENVDIQDINASSHRITQKLEGLLASHKTGPWQARCEHVEQVKTYAPGVVHCVFDVLVQPVIDGPEPIAAF